MKQRRKKKEQFEAKASGMKNNNNKCKYQCRQAAGFRASDERVAAMQ